MAEPQRSKCKGCGRDIVWAVLPQGGRVPLDPRPPVYTVRHHVTDEGDVTVAERDTTAMVSHFATCPEAGQFSGSKRKKGPQP